MLKWSLSPTPFYRTVPLPLLLIFVAVNPAIMKKNVHAGRKLLLALLLTASFHTLGAVRARTTGPPSTVRLYGRITRFGRFVILHRVSLIPLFRILSLARP